VKYQQNIISIEFISWIIMQYKLDNFFLIESNPFLIEFAKL